MSEEVNRECPDRNTTVQLSSPYTDSERHSAQRHRQTDRQTDRYHHVRSAKKSVDDHGAIRAIGNIEQST